MKIKHVRCNVCKSTDVIPGDINNFQCNNCGFGYNVIMLDDEERDNLINLSKSTPKPNDDLKKLMKGKG